MAKYAKYFNYLLDLRNKDFFVIDSHVHPLDVLGLAINQNVDKEGELNKYFISDLRKKSLAERLKYGSIYKIIVRALTRLSPSLIESYINQYYKDTSELHLRSQMRNSLVDKTTLVPLLPHVSTDELIHLYPNKNKHYYLGSADLADHQMTSERFMIDLERQLSLGICGIKMHPNIQQFHPNIKMNTGLLYDRLSSIFKFCDAHKLYILTHVGRTNFIGKKKKQYAIFKNYFQNNRIQILEDYNVNIVFAHLTKYAQIFSNRNFIDIAISRYGNRILFDTAGCSQGEIKNFVKRYGFDNIVFGSDAYYNSMNYSLQMCLVAIIDIKSSIPIETRLRKVFHDNITSFIKR